MKELNNNDLIVVFEILKTFVRNLEEKKEELSDD